MEEDGPAGPSPDEAGIPLWVKVFGILAILALAAFLILHAAGASPLRHGP